jgi:uncharacterized protein YjiK
MKVAYVAAALFAQSAAAADFSAPAGMFKMSGVLTEISGLAPAGPHTVFAHNDEFAIVHEIDVKTGAIVRSFALGKPTVPGDFEGVAYAGGFIYLVTSKGLIYEARPGEHGKRVDYNIYDTRLGKECEIEGMAPAESPGEFYLLCKHSAFDKEGKRLILYKWSYAERLKPLKPVIDVAWKKIARASKDFKAADLERDPKSGDLLIVDAAAAAVVEISTQGAPIGYYRLLGGRHPQAEGLALLPDGSVIVGDEGQGGEGLLTTYPPRR